MKNIITIIFLFLATTVAWGQSCSTFQGTTDPGYVLTAGQLALSGTNSFTGAIGKRYKLNLIAGQTYVINGCTGFDGTFNTDLEFSIFNYSTASLYQDDNDDCGSDNDETYTFVAPYTGLYWLLLSENDCDIACSFGCTGTVSVTCTTCPSSAPAVPPIGENNPVATDFCTDAPLVQNLSGYAGSTSSAYTATGDAPSLVSNFCGSIENNSFIKFVASSTTSTFEFWIPSCSVGVDGVQFQVFSVTGSCSTGTWTSVSNGCVNPTGGAGSWGEFVATGLTIGNTYYIVFDGFAGNVCDYVIKAQSGVATCPLTPGNVSQVCNAAGTSYTVEIPFTGGGTKTYTITGGTNTGDNPSSVASGTMIIGPFSNNTGYTINISTADGICDYDFSVPTYSCPDYCAAINPVDNGTTTCGTPFNLSYVEQPVYEAVQTSCGMVNVSSPTIVTLTDDDSELDLPIGFTFNFFGTTYTTFNLHSNGIISFDAPGSDANGNYLGYSAVTIPNGTTLPNNYIAGLYTDLNPTCGGSVTYKTIGTAPNRQLVVTWTNIEPYQSGCGAPDTEEVTFQIVLTEGTNAINTIVSTLPSTFGTSWSNPSSATQGVEAGDGAVAFTTPSRNWQVWTGITPTDLDCTTFQPVPLTVVFNGWYTGGAGGTLVGTGNPQAVTPSSTTTYTGSWVVNGKTCTKDVTVTVSGGPTITLGTATNVTACGLTDGTIPLTFTNVPNGTYTLSYEKDGTPATASITVASNAATLTGLGAGSYANFSITVSGCTATAAGPRNITAPSAPVTTGATICTGGSGTLTSTSCAAATGTTTVCASIGGTFGSSPGLNYNLDFSAIPLGATVTSISYEASSGSTTDWMSEIDFNISSPTLTDGLDLDFGACCGGTNSGGPFSFPAGTSNNFNALPAQGNWNVEWHDDASPYDGTLTADTDFCLTVNWITPASTLQWYTAATGGTPVQTGSPFNPVGDAEVIAAGAPYSSLTNTNTPGTYTFYAACSGAPNCRAATNFVINAGPSVTASNNGPLTCTKTSVTLSPSAASGTITYAWPGGLTSVSSAGSYTVTATDSANGCTATSSTTVTANTTPPSVTASNDGPLTCTKTSVTLSPSAASGTITYAWPGGLTSVSSAGSYTVTATDSANGCNATSSTTVTANTTPPSVTASNDGPLTCTKTSVTLSPSAASGTITYAWPGGLTSVSSAGSYTVTATDSANGCNATSSTTVTANITPPSVTASNDGPLTCTKTSVTLSPSAASGTITYAWPGGLTSVSSAGSYTVTATDSANGCNATSSTTVTANTTPPTFTGTASCSGGANTGSVSQAATDGSGTYTYSISGGSFGPTLANGTYTVTVNDTPTGCQSTGTVTISCADVCPTLTAQAPAAVVSSQSTCSGCALSGGVIAAPSTTCPAGSTLQYSTNGGTIWSSVLPTYNQTTAVTVMTRCNCDVDNTQSSPTNSVTTVPGTCTVPSATAGDNDPACGGTLMLTSSGGGTYAWTGPNGFTSAMQNPTISNVNGTHDGAYTVVVTDSGCASTATTTVNTITCSGTRTLTIVDPCSCNNDASTSINGTPALPVVNGTFDETVEVAGLIAGDVVTVTAISGMYSAPGTLYVPATATAAVVTSIPTATLQGIHVDNVGYSITFHISNTTPGFEFEGDISIANKCRYPDPDFSIGSFVDCSTPIAVTLTHSALEGAGNLGTALFSPTLGGTSPNYTLNPAGLTGTQTITLTYTGFNDGNGGVAPGGPYTDASAITTPAFPGCQEVIQKTINVNCPGCAASSTMQWGGN